VARGGDFRPGGWRGWRGCVVKFVVGGVGEEGRVACFTQFELLSGQAVKLRMGPPDCIRTMS